MSAQTALTPNQQASVDFSPVPDNISTLFARWNNPNVSFNADDQGTLEGWINQHPTASLSQRYLTAIGTSVAPPSQGDMFALPTLSQVGNTIGQSFQDPHTIYETVTNPLGSPLAQQLFRAPGINTFTFGISGNVAALDTVSTRYLSGDGVSDADRTSAMQGLVKIGVAATTWGVGSYFAGAAAPAEGEAFAAESAAESESGAVLVDEGGFTYASEPVVTTEEMVAVDPSDAALYETADTATPIGEPVTPGSPWTTKDYLQAGLLTGSTTAALLRGDSKGAAAGLGAPGFLTDFLPNADNGGSGGGGSTLFPNNYQSSSQNPQASNSVVPTSASIETKTIVYVIAGLALLVLLKKVKMHG